MGKVFLAKLSWYSHYMDFLSNTFVVQGQGTYVYVILTAKDSWEKLLRSSKKPY